MKEIADLSAEGKRLLESGNAISAEKIFRSSLQKYPDDPSLQYLLATSIARQGRLLRASRILQRLVRQTPRLAHAHELLADILVGLNKPADAIASYGRAVSFGQGLLSPESMVALRKSVDLEAKNANSWRILGEAYAKSSKPREAIEAFEKGLEIAPDDGPLLSLLGNEHRTLGHQQDAIAAYEKCISLHPAAGPVYYSLANLKTYHFDDHVISTMEEQLASDDLSDEVRVNFHFAIGEAYDDRGDYARGFEHFTKGNSLRRQREVYDAEYTRSMVARITDVFSRELLCKDMAVSSDDSAGTPIFIVGLPRSGSTLLEQILSSHSAVEGTHELPELGQILSRLVAGNKAGDRFPEIISELTDESLAQIARQYLDSTRKYRSGKQFFIDKMPNNFLFAGAIRMALPNAKIINAKRHPLGTCISSYRQLFYDGQSYTYELSELGQYYVAYDALIRHWHDVMPGFVLDVSYEDVVSDLESQVQRMLDFCGLPFEDACLHFHESDRAVASASSEQVRQPIYSESLDAWRNYLPYVDELVDALDPVLTA